MMVGAPLTWDRISSAGGDALLYIARHGKVNRFIDPVVGDCDMLLDLPSEYLLNNNCKYEVDRCLDYCRDCTVCHSNRHLLYFARTNSVVAISAPMIPTSDSVHLRLRDSHRDPEQTILNFPYHTPFPVSQNQ
jgi:hypothetical protein